MFVEHRATAICIEAVSRLRTLLPVDSEAPAAVGCAPAGDPYALPTMCAAAVLAEAGFRTTNLGPDTPFDALLQATAAVKPRLVWVAVTIQPSNVNFGRDLAALARALGGSKAALVVGGRGAEAHRRPGRRPYHVLGTMTELAELGKQLLQKE